MSGINRLFRSGPNALWASARQFKPQGVPTIDWSHPLARGLVSYWFDTGSGFYVDLVTRRKTTATATGGSTAAPKGTTQFGSGFQFTSTLTEQADPAAALNQTWAAPYSFATGFVRLGTPTNNFSGVFQIQNNGGSGNGFYLDTSNALHIPIGNGTLSPTVAISANVFNVAVCSATGSSAASGWVNGANASTHASTTGFTLTAMHYTFNTNASSYNSAVTPSLNNCAVFFGAAWVGRALTQEEAATLYTDPYCFLIPQSVNAALNLPGSNIDATAVLSAAATLTGDAARFVAGIYDETGTTNSATLPADSYSELEFGLALDSSHLTAGDVLTFYVYANGIPLGFYDQIPQVTFVGGGVALAASAVLAADSALIGSPRLYLPASAVAVASAALVANPNLSLVASAALVASASLVTNPNLYLVANAALVASASLSASLLQKFQITTVFAASATLVANPQLYLVALATVSSSASLSASLVGTVQITAVLSASTSLVANPQPYLLALSTLSASAALVANPQLYLPIAATLAASLTLTTATSLYSVAVATLTASASLVANPQLYLVALAILSASASLTASLAQKFQITTVLAADSSLVGNPQIYLVGAVALSASASLAANPQSYLVASAIFTASATLAEFLLEFESISAVLSASSSLATTDRLFLTASAALVVSTTLSARLQGPLPLSTALAADSSLAANPQLYLAALAVLTASASLIPALAIKGIQQITAVLAADSSLVDNIKAYLAASAALIASATLAPVDTSIDLYLRGGARFAASASLQAVAYKLKEFISTALAASSSLTTNPKLYLVDAATLAADSNIVTNPKARLIAAAALAASSTLAVTTKSYQVAAAALTSSASLFSVPAPRYVANAVHFDGATTVGLTDQGAGLASDSSTGLVSVWVRGSNFFNTGGGATINLFADTGNANVTLTNHGFSVNEINRLSLNLWNASNSSHYIAYTPPFSTTDWVWLGLSWDLNHASGLRTVQVFYGDVVQSQSNIAEGGAAFTANYSDTGWYLGSGSPDQGAALGVLGEEADFQMWCGGTFVDLSVTANRRLFIDNLGHPVNPSIATASLGQPTILLSGDTSLFATNQGSGGATGVLAGSLTSASSSPSDGASAGILLFEAAVATLAASSSLSVTATDVVVAAATLNASASISAATKLYLTAATTLAADSSLRAATRLFLTTSAALAADSQLSATAPLRQVIAAVLAASATFTVHTGANVFLTTAVLSASSTLTAASSLYKSAVAILSASSTLTLADGVFYLRAAATLTANLSSSFIVSANLILAANAILAASGSVSATTAAKLLASAALYADSTFSASQQIYLRGAATLSASGVLAALILRTRSRPINWLVCAGITVLPEIQGDVSIDAELQGLIEANTRIGASLRMINCESSSVEPHGTMPWGTGTEKPSYHAKAVHFDGSTVLQNTTSLASLLDSPAGLFSIWVIGGPDTAVDALFNFGNADFFTLPSLVYNAGVFQAATGGPFVAYEYGSATPLSATWHHCLMSWNTNHAAGLKLFALYIDDVPIPIGTTFDSGAAFNATWAVSTAWFCATTNLDPSNIGDFSDTILYTQTAIVRNDNTIDETDRRNFISAAGIPVDPSAAIAAYGTPDYLFSGDKDAFPINQGSGPGDFQIIGGVLSDAVTGPSP